MDDYPLHKYAYGGNAAAIKEFLAQGYDPNQLDRDSWAPIHYAAWLFEFNSSFNLQLHLLLRIVLQVRSVGSCSNAAQLW